MADPLVIEGVPDVSYEDSGCAMILEVSDHQQAFVRLQSYHEDPRRPITHDQLEPLIGKRLRVTVEVVER